MATAWRVDRAPTPIWGQAAASFALARGEGWQSLADVFVLMPPSG